MSLKMYKVSYQVACLIFTYLDLKKRIFKLKPIAEEQHVDPTREICSILEKTKAIKDLAGL